MSHLYYDLFYFFAKFYGHTNKNIPIIFIVSVGVMAILILSIIKKMSHDSPTIEALRDLFAVGLVIICVILVFLSGTKEPLKDLKVTTNVGNYREINAQKYRLDEYISDKLTTLTSAEVIHYRLTYVDNDDDLFKTEHYVYKKTEKYEKAPELSKYPKKYHKKTLIKVFIRPVKVTTDWRGIKESYNLYEVQEVYKVEPDLVKYEDDQVFNK